MIYGDWPSKVAKYEKLTLTAKVLAMFLSEVVKNGSSVTTPAAFTL
jgi:hypothetical protein